MRDFISTFDNALSSKECEQIITYFESFKEYDKKEKAYKKEERDCDTLGLNFNKKEYEPSNRIISKILYDYTQKYVDINPELKNVYTFGLFYGFNLQRYKPNQCYRLPHTENNGIFKDRMMAWTIYLNTVTDGGGTHYTQYNKTIDAVEGRLVIWPAYWTHFHHGVVSKTQTKYIATGWYTFADVNK